MERRSYSLPSVQNGQIYLVDLWLVSNSGPASSPPPARAAVDLRSMTEPNSVPPDIIFRRAGYEAIDRICNLHANLEDRDVCAAVSPGYLKDALPHHVPEKGEDFQDIADDYQKLIHPAFFAYFPTPATFEAVLGDLYASSTANPGFNARLPALLVRFLLNLCLEWDCSPACTELEEVVMDWSAGLFALDKAFYSAHAPGGGVIQTSASDSALATLVAARVRHTDAHPDVELGALVLYTTTQTHSLGAKAARVLGLRVRALEVRVVNQLALRGATLRAALDEDKKTVATVETTSSGAVDDLPEIFAVAQEHPGLWVHVDAAWAGVALACPELRGACHLAAISAHAHSLCINFHKVGAALSALQWGLANFDCSALWVRERARLTGALDITPEYLRDARGAHKDGDNNKQSGAARLRNWHPSLSRRFRALKVWFVLRSYGVEGFRAHVRKGIALNERFAARVRASGVLALAAPPSFVLSVFRAAAPAPASADPEETTALETELTRRLYARCRRAGSRCSASASRRAAFEAIEAEACAVLEELGAGDGGGIP
ncbi:pyridoxal phosphate-dependent transferase [Phellopilus nigrolimitatus]|nr:pyridoxal phosphate-dependent transferase [Phellopilus nigrolimitatus]